MLQVTSDPIDRVIVVSQLIYAAVNIACFMLDIAGNRVIEIPEKLVDNCFCARLARAVGTEINLEQAFKRLRDACVMDTNLTHCCPYGLSAITVPVKSADKLVAVISFGPIMTKDPQEIIEQHVRSKEALSVADKRTLIEYLYSIERRNGDFLNAFSQIISLALHNNIEVGHVQGVPISESGRGDNNPKPILCPDTVEAALLYMAENFTNDITLTDVAEHVFVHPTYLSKLFNRYVSFNFRDYLNHLRIAKARLLLLDPRKTIASICFEVGFSDQSYFNWVFKAIEGITPGHYRDQNLPNRREGIRLVHKKDAPDKYRHMREDAMRQRSCQGV